MKKWYILSAIGVLVVALSLSVGRGSTNCGGNNAALSNVKTIAMLAKGWADEVPSHVFRFTEADAKQRETLSYLARTSWCGDARFLVTAGPVSGHVSESPRIIAVCDTPFRNVPQRLIGDPPATHAAAMSDGTARLLSTEEFAQLNFAEFAALDSLVPSTE